LKDKKLSHKFNYYLLKEGKIGATRVIGPKIYERIYILDLNMDLIFQEEPTQCYLDTYIYDTIRSSKKEVTLSKRKVPVQLKFSI